MPGGRGWGYGGLSCAWKILSPGIPTTDLKESYLQKALDKMQRCDPGSRNHSLLLTHPLQQQGQRVEGRRVLSWAESAGAPEAEQARGRCLTNHGACSLSRFPRKKEE